MMGIVIDHGDACHFSFVLESPICASEMEKTLLDSLCGYADLPGKGYGGKGVGYIVDAGYGQRKMSNLFTFTDTVKRRAGGFVKDNIFCCVLGVAF